VDDGVDAAARRNQGVEVADIGDDVCVGTGAASETDRIEAAARARQAFITNPPIRPLAPVTSTRGRARLAGSRGQLRGASPTLELIVRPFPDGDGYVARAGVCDRWRVELTQ